MAQGRCYVRVAALVALIASAVKAGPPPQHQILAENFDTVVGATDYAWFQACYAVGSGGFPWGCQHLDFDGDNDVDAADYFTFCKGINGPG